MRGPSSTPITPLRGSHCTPVLTSRERCALSDIAPCPRSPWRGSPKRSGQNMRQGPCLPITTLYSWLYLSARSQYHSICLKRPELARSRPCASASPPSRRSCQRVDGRRTWVPKQSRALLDLLDFAWKVRAQRGHKKPGYLSEAGWNGVEFIRPVRIAELALRRDDEEIVCAIILRR